MKELDVLLERFLVRQANALRDGRWPELEALLDTEDDCLWDWLQGRAAPPKDWCELIDVIRR